MTKNKLIFEDCCLTIEQAKELRDLGYEFSNSLLCFDRKRNLHIGNAKDFIPYPNCMVNTHERWELLSCPIHDGYSTSKAHKSLVCG